MITKRISTETILANLKKKVDARIPIMISSAGSGLVAKLQEAAGTDCINTFSGARLRANGMGILGDRLTVRLCLIAYFVWFKVCS